MVSSATTAPTIFEFLPNFHGNSGIIYMRDAVICACVKILPRNLDAPPNFSVDNGNFVKIYTRNERSHMVYKIIIC